MTESQSPTGEVDARSRSTVQFPYGDLDDALAVALGIHKNSGQECTPDQLAAWLGHGTTNSGAFRNKLSSARIFGVVAVGRNKVSLTALGHEIVDQKRQEAAKVRAFLNVELYRKLFDEYKHKQLPPDSGLEAELVRFGVAPKQKDRARQAFQRSAAQAGFFRSGKDRLVQPPVTEAAGDADKGQSQRSGVKSGGMDETDQHPLIQGLVGTLPPPGQPFPAKRQTQWIEAAKQIFGLLWPNDEPESRSSLGNGAATQTPTEGS